MAKNKVINGAAQFELQDGRTAQVFPMGYQSPTGAKLEYMSIYIDGGEYKLEDMESLMTPDDFILASKLQESINSDSCIKERVWAGDKSAYGVQNDTLSADDARALIAKGYNH